MSANPEVEPTIRSNLFGSETLDVNVDALFKNGNRYQGRLSCYLMEGEATYSWRDGTTYKVFIKFSFLMEINGYGIYLYRFICVLVHA